MPAPYAAAVELAFSAELWRHDGDGGWHFVTLPVDVADAVRDQAPPRQGFGSVRVTVAVGVSRWATSLFPDSRSGSYVLPVKAAVRRANELAEGDVVGVRIELAD